MAFRGATVHRRVSEDRTVGINSTNGARSVRLPYPRNVASPTSRRAVMSRRQFLEQTDRLIDEGDALTATPHWDLFRAWLLNSDELLERVWGRMDRYHLAWLNVGRDPAPSGSDLDEAGTARFIAEVASAKVAVLRTMRIAVAKRGWRNLSDDDEEDR